MDFSRLTPAARRKRNLFAHVVEALGSRIVRGEFEPGTTLPNETDLGGELGASRTVVREAVKTLAAKGLLEPRARTGTHVLPPSAWNLLDLDVLEWRYASMPRAQFFRELFEIRALIEPPAAGYAAQRATEAELAALEAALARMEAAEAGSDEGIDADLGFHRGILGAAHNDLLSQMGRLIGVGLITSERIFRRSYGTFLPLHRRLFEAIRERDPMRARDAMQELLVRTREFVEREIGRAPDAG